MDDASDRPATALSRRTAARLLLGGSVAGLAAGAAGAASAGGDDFRYTMAFHSPYGKPVDYAFEVTEGPKALDHAPNLDIPDDSVSADRGTEIDGAVARGTVNGGYDVFAYDGDLLAFEVTGGDCADLEVWETGSHLDACQLQSQLPGFGGAPDCPPTVVDSCRVIDEPGYYVLDGDVDGTDDHATKDSVGREICIEIAADDVVLDGRGHALRGGQKNPDVGIRVIGNDVVVRDVEAIDWGIGALLQGNRTRLHGASIDNDDRPNRELEAGLQVEGAACTIRDLEVLTGPIGVNLQSATDAVLAESSITGLNLGIVLDGATGCVLRNNAAGSSGGDGLAVEGSADNLVVGNDLGGFGIGVSFYNSRGHVLRQNSFDSNDDLALAIANCEEFVLIGNDASGTESGISLEDVSDSVLQGNTVDDTSGTGIEVVGGSTNVLTGNVTDRNEGAGIELEGTIENVLSANTVKGNSTGQDPVGGIHLVDADRNTVVRNTVCDNAGPSQIVVEGSSSGNRIASNDTTC